MSDIANKVLAWKEDIEEQYYEGNFDAGELIDDALSIEREQYLDGGTWITNEITIILATGGPHIEYKVYAGCLVGYWSGEEYYAYLDSNIKEEIISVVEEVI